MFSAYVIAFGGLLLLGGRLSDLLGARRVFVAGFALLAAAALLAGLAWSDDALVVGRALQGVGAALIAPSAMAIVLGLLTTPSELGKAMAVWSASAPAGGTAGVFLGGVITEWISWRWTFLVNVPVAIAVLALVPSLLPRAAGRRGRIDVAGALAVTAAISLVVYATVTAPGNGWSSARTIGVFAAAAALLAVFVAVEARRRDPLVPLGIFRAHNLSAANTVMALLGAAWIPMWFFLNLYLQHVLPYDAFESGLALLPMTGAIMLLMVGVTGRLVAPVRLQAAAGRRAGAARRRDRPAGADPRGRLVRRRRAAGLARRRRGDVARVHPGAGRGALEREAEESGLASGLVNTTYQVGSALGLAAMTAVATGVSGSAPDVVSLTDGYRAAFVGAALVALVASVAAALAVTRPRPAVAQPDEGASLREAA